MQPLDTEKDIDSSTQNSARICLVDDSVANLTLLSDILTDEGYLVDSFDDGKKALQFAIKNPPDLILLDIMMPDASGYQVCEKLKNDRRTRDAPVIFISAKNDIFDKIKAFSLGGVDFIPKPFQVDEVLARVKTHLKLRRLQQSLESKNQELIKTLRDLKSAQRQLIKQEKMAALGQLIAGVAHEINTPLGAIRASAENIFRSMEWCLQQIPDLLRSLSREQRENFLRLVKKSFEDKTPFCSRDSRKWRKRIKVKFENLGVESPDSVADLIVSMGLQNNIKDFIPLLKSSRRLKIFEAGYHLHVQYHSCKNIKMAQEKAANVVFALKSFVHFPENKTKVMSSISEGVKVVLTLYRNHFKKGLRLITDLKRNPVIPCYPDELNQVWSNLVQNAVHAMKGRGTLEIKVDDAGGWVWVQIIDSGPGVPNEIQEKIFEPFFTTKPIGEGSGLGLDIVKKVVDRHCGRIELESEPGCTKFTVFLPKEKNGYNNPE